MGRQPYLSTGGGGYTRWNLRLAVICDVDPAADPSPHNLKSAPCISIFKYPLINITLPEIPQAVLYGIGYFHAGYVTGSQRNPGSHVADSDAVNYPDVYFLIGWNRKLYIRGSINYNAEARYRVHSQAAVYPGGVAAGAEESASQPRIRYHHETGRSVFFPRGR